MVHVVTQLRKESQGLRHLPEKKTASYDAACIEWIKRMVEAPK